jgi:hypothetical protein
VSQACERVRAEADLLVREEPGGELLEHCRACAACAAVLEGARGLRAQLQAFAAPAPPADLTERTLARLAVAALSPAGEEAPAGELVQLPARALRRRTSMVERLTEPPGAIQSPIAPTRRQLAWRLVIQSAAAVLLAATCAGLGAAMYPAVVEALEERRQDRCQERLRRLGEALRTYRREHPDAPASAGAELRAALVQGGYSDETDLLCPSHAAPGATGYALELPAADEPGDPPVCWDQFRHHPVGINVVYRSGRSELVRAADLATWARRLRAPAAGEGE